MLTNVIRYADGRYPYAAGAAMEPGDVVVRPCGTLALFDGMFGAASGELVSPQPLVPTQIAEMKTASGTTWSAGATLYWDAAAKLVTNVSTSNTRIGLATTAKTSGQTTHVVNLTPA